MFPAVVVLLFATTAAHAAFGIRYVIPGATRLELGTFSSLSHEELLVKDPDGAARIYSTVDGTVTATMPASFTITGWQRLVGDFDLDNRSDILTWKNLAGGGAQIELYRWNGSAMVRAWNVTRATAVDGVQQVYCLPTASSQIVVVTAADSSRGLDVLDPLTGGQLLSIAPVPQASVHVEADEWDTSSGSDVLFAALDGTGKGTWRLIGDVGGTIGVKWSYIGRLVMGARVVQADRRDLLVVNTSNEGHIVNADTGTEILYLGPGFVTDGSVVTRLVDVDYDNVQEVLQNATMFRPVGNTLTQQWQLPSGGVVEEVVQAEIDGNFSNAELVFRSQNTLQIVDGVTGTIRFHSDNVGQSHATAMWADDLVPGNNQEVLAYFPHDEPSPSCVMMIGLVSPGQIGVRYQRDAGALLGMAAYDPNALCVLERDLPGTSASLYDVATGAHKATLPSAFSVAASTITTLTGLDGDGAPELLQQAPPGGGADGTRLLEWNGTNYALVWKVSTTYPSTLPLAFAQCTPGPYQVGFVGAGGMLLLQGSNGATLYDAAAQGFTSVVSAEVGNWEQPANSYSGVLMQASGATRPAGIYLLSATAQPVDVGDGARADLAPRLIAAPNPFRTASRLSFVMPVAGNAGLHVFDASGRRVRTLASGRLAAGAHAVDWNGRDDRGNTVPVGIYWTRLTTPAGRVSARMVRVP
jgi:hypothetical protein